MASFSFGPPASDLREGAQDNSPANAAPGSMSSLFLFGLSTSSTLTSSLEWSVARLRGPVYVNNRTAIPFVRTAILQLTGGPLRLFHYTPYDDSVFIPPEIPLRHLHALLALGGGKPGFLVLHDASNPSLTNSMRCLRHCLGLQARFGGRGVWVAISSPDSVDCSNVSAGLAARFGAELRDAEMPDGPEQFVGFGRRVLRMPVVHACRVIGEAMFDPPRSFLPVGCEAGEAPQQLTDRDFREGFARGSIRPWRHKDYVRAAYLTLLERENRDTGLLEVATKFAANVHSFKQRNSQFQLQPESRTLTVFWLYHVKLAITAMSVYQQDYRELAHFKRIFHYLPELIDEKMATAYYSSDILKSEYAEKFWMLPNLRELVEPLRHPNVKFRGQLAKKDQEDPERLLQFAFAVVQRYFRAGETRRRAWFINLAFGALQQQTTRLRSMHPWISAYSETRSYFYIQLVHAALSQLITTGKAKLVHDMSYPLFRETFGILPSAWTTYYSPQLWDSLKARASFVPPDLKPLPDCIPPPNHRLEPPLPNPNEPFRQLGFIPELPSLEVLHFHQAILLENAKPLPPTPTPSEVTSHAHLLKYIHTHLILPLADLESGFTHHLTLLTTASPLPTAHITYYLHLLRPQPKDPDYNPPIPQTPRHPSYTDPKTGKFIRHHNCPCHASLNLPYEVGPNAVLYPRDPPYEHPPQLTHGCLCHASEELDHDLFAALCAEDFREREEDEKRRRGEVVPGAGNGGVEWEVWVRGEGGLVLCWDEAWKGSRDGGLQGVGGKVESGGVEGGKSDGGKVDDGESESEDSADTDADETTLAGEEEDDEDWDAVSQVTL